jgi:hypothetical protein
MSDDDEFMGEDDVAEANVLAAPKPAAKPEPAKPAKAEAKGEAPLPHEVAAAIGHDPIFALDIVIACANHEQNRRCPALANIVQSFAINRQEMVDWLERVAQRTADRAARNEEAAK